jgi:hypothetical protein
MLTEEDEGAFMRTFWLALMAACLTANGWAATIQTTVTNLGGGASRYNYSINLQPGDTILTNYTLDISFDPTVFTNLSNGVAQPATDWSLLLLEPNTPFPGAFGDYLATAKVDNPSLAGPFSVDVTFAGTPGFYAQPFVLFDANFTPVTSGTTTTTTPTIPEPHSAALMLIGLVAGYWFFYARKNPSKVG